MQRISSIWVKSVRNQFISHPGLNPAEMHPAVSRRHEVIVVTGVNRLKIAALPALDISN